MNVYIVKGHTGEYSDRNDWIVCAYQDKDKAELLVKNASRRASEIFAEMERDILNSWYGERNDLKYINEYDPSMQMDYTGTYYTYDATELRDA